MRWGSWCLSRIPYFLLSLTTIKIPWFRVFVCDPVCLYPNLALLLVWLASRLYSPPEAHVPPYLTSSSRNTKHTLVMYTTQLAFSIVLKIWCWMARTKTLCLSLKRTLCDAWRTALAMCRASCMVKSTICERSLKLDRQDFVHLVNPWHGCHQQRLMKLHKMWDGNVGDVDCTKHFFLTLFMNILRGGSRLAHRYDSMLGISLSPRSETMCAMYRFHPMLQHHQHE